MKQINLTLAVTGIGLLLFNFFAISELSVEVSRWIRILSSVTITVLYFIFTKKLEKIFVFVFLLFIITDFLILGFNDPSVRFFYIILMIITYTSLITYIFPFLKNLRANLFQGIMLIIVIPVNVFLIFLVMEIAGDKIPSLLHAMFFFLYGIIILMLITTAFSYNSRYTNKASFYFICSMLSLVVCDISGFISIYVPVWEFYYPSRLFYLLGLLTLVKFASLDRNEIIAEDSEIL